MESIRQLFQNLRGWGQVSGKAVWQPSVSELSIIWDVIHQKYQSEANLLLFSVQPMGGAPASETVMNSSCAAKKSVPHWLTSGQLISCPLCWLNCKWVQCTDFFVLVVSTVFLSFLCISAVCVSPGLICCFFLSGRISVKPGIHFMNMKEKNITGCHTNTLTVNTHIIIHITHCTNTLTVSRNSVPQTFLFPNLKIRLKFPLHAVWVHMLISSVRNLLLEGNLWPLLTLTL